MIKRDCKYYHYVCSHYGARCELKDEFFWDDGQGDKFDCEGCKEVKNET